MGPLNIRDLDGETHNALRIQAARARAAGCAIGVADGQIAAIAATHGFTVATRDTAVSAAAGVATIDPWIS